MTPPKDKVLSEDDRRVWQQVAATVKPLPVCFDNEIFSEVLDSPPMNVAPVRSLPAARPAVMRSKPAVGLPELTVGHMPGLDKRLAERVKRGVLATDGRIDLHGLTRDQAQNRLIQFIVKSYEHGLRKIVVITGKGQAGGGVLKIEVPRWLNLPVLRSKVLGFSYAQPKDGGEGALYVLLKRHRTV